MGESLPYGVSASLFASSSVLSFASPGSLMSSRKRAGKEKLAVEEAVSAPRNAQELLSSERATTQPVNFFPPYNNNINYNCGRPFGCYRTEGWQAAEAWRHKTPPASALRAIKAYITLVRSDGLVKETPVEPFDPAEAADNVEQQLCEALSLHQLLHAWRRQVAHLLPSALVYPHHVLTLNLAPGLLPSQTVSCNTPVAVAEESSSPTVERSRTTAALNSHWASPTEELRRVSFAVRQIVCAHTDLTNRQFDRSTYSPGEDYEKMLGYSLYASGYVGPEAEQKNVTFSPTAGCTAANAIPADANREIYLVRHCDSTHINVCCSSYYYRLEVVSRSSGMVRGVDEIALGLEAIRSHASETAEAHAGMQVSAEVREDLSGIRTLFSRMSGVHDHINADLRRRLREASPVNGYTLDQLEGALFTLVIGNEREGGSQWLHTGLSLCVPWDLCSPITFRVHATLMPMQTLMHFAEHVFRTVYPVQSVTPAIHQYKTPAEIVEVRGALQPSPGTGNASQVTNAKGASTGSKATSTSVAPTTVTPKDAPERAASTPPATHTVLQDGVTFLELWLPLHHRIPLRPYAPLYCPVQWRDLSLVQQTPLTTCELCLAVIAVTQRCLQEEGCSAARRPRVRLAVQHPSCALPNLLVLYSPEIDDYLQVHCSSSVRITAEVHHRAKCEALVTLKELLQQAEDPHYPLYTMTNHLVAEVSESDVCLTMTTLPLMYLKDNRSVFSVRHCYSDLGIPARLQLRCVAVQQLAEKRCTLGTCVVQYPEVGADHNSRQFSVIFAEHLREELERQGGDGLNRP